MTPENDNFDKILEQLVASTRSPRGRFSAKNSWKILERRISPASGKNKISPYRRKRCSLHTHLPGQLVYI